MSASTTTPRERTRAANRAGFGAFIGSTIEWFDFYIYGTAAALVFDKVFFPELDGAIGTLVAFATFWVGFLARPIGGVIFGHYGDRLGRKKTLVITLLMMGISTTAIGLLPGYASIGIAAPILLVAIRMVQGIGLGGEWGGSVLIASEHAPKGKSVLYGAFAQQGSPVGNTLSTLSFLAISQLPDEAFVSWGWRLPFLFSAALVIVGLFVRLKVAESPAMANLIQKKEVVKVPLTEVLRTQPMLIVLGIGACTIGLSATYFKSTFALSWATSSLDFDRSSFLTIILVANVTQIVVQPFGALIATRMKSWSRAVTVMLLPELVLMPLMFVLIGTENYGLAMVGVAVATIPHCLYYAALAGMLASRFPAHLRYTGISLCYQLCGTLLGGTTPIIGQFLLNRTGSITAVIAYAVLQVVLTLGCMLLLLKRPNHDEQAAEPLAAPRTVPVTA
ncbi:MFS transporter [Streptomyces sp. NBC_01707]|jgi:MFS family permease|uniref:MFS transporter n=1 Tax=unclassified Streptomyces TaxID=2593676 RepID=UPI0004C5405D|nr:MULTISPECIES: MFS transporter [unclassified Streptomyces]MDX3767298.1 MFS transporter [Streptomyces sp. AK08-01B]MDX3817286.1 MFS transporter [Streptomyces sp. AK08-01A]WSQ26463.1 MFS transporter [Streptomyces sp. NBC_01230]SCY99424.1 Major Facilitator Superfamily protein [Streptomyces sp. 136MFCol5.1]SFT05128.1 Major Facilitator Superfamily protein [Streptomyces sp. ok210]